MMFLKSLLPAQRLDLHVDWLDFFYYLNLVNGFVQFRRVPYLTILSKYLLSKSVFNLEIYLQTGSQEILLKPLCYINTSRDCVMNLTYSHHLDVLF